jgi:transposase-like protein
LDATHLNSEDKGTLYMATVKSGNKEVLPIAFRMTKANENFIGWKYFLEGLKRSCPILPTVHPSEKCQSYLLFTYISDQDKGLILALTEVFQNNHRTNCLHHIKQNVKTKFRLKVSNLVGKIGPTFSIRYE